MGLWRLAAPVPRLHQPSPTLGMLTLTSLSIPASLVSATHTRYARPLAPTSVLATLVLNTHAYSLRSPLLLTSTFAALAAASEFQVCYRYARRYNPRP